MRRDEVIAKLNNAMPELRQRFDVATLSIFGSVARGDDGPASDVDILVAFANGPTLSKYCRLLDHLSVLLGSKVDLVTIGAVRPRLAAEIARDGVRVA